MSREDVDDFDSLGLGVFDFPSNPSRLLPAFETQDMQFIGPVNHGAVVVLPEVERLGHVQLVRHVMAMHYWGVRAFVLVQQHCRVFQHRMVAGINHALVRMAVWAGDVNHLVEHGFTFVGD